MSIFDKTDSFPLSGMGPGAANGGTSPLSPFIANLMQRGRVPILTSRDTNSTALELDRAGMTWVPARVVLDLVERGANYSPVNPIFGQATIASGVASFTLAAPSGTLTDPTYRGRDYRFAGIALDVNISALTAPGQVKWNLSFYSESQDIITQSVTLLPGQLGTARYYLMFTRITQGGTYPILAVCQRDLLAAPPGVAQVVTTNSEGGPTQITFTNGVRSANFGIENSFVGPDGTNLNATLLVPGTMLWDEAYSRWLAAGLIAEKP